MGTFIRLTASDGHDEFTEIPPPTTVTSAFSIVVGVSAAAILGRTVIGGL